MKGLSVFDKIVFLLNIVLGLLLLVCCLIPYVQVKTFPLLSFLGLIVPTIIMANIPFLRYWGIRKKKLFFLSFFALLVSYFNFGPFYRFGSSKDSFEEGLKIMTYNTRDFNFKGRSNTKLTGHEIIDFVNQNDPDIVCFQESNSLARRQLDNYPFKYVTPLTSNKSRQAIFSKYPIVGKGSLEFPETANNGIYADVVYKGDTIRIYNLHFQSFQIIPSRVRSIKRVAHAYRKMKTTFIKQEEQANIFDKHRKNSPYKYIVCADLNNTSFSHVYRFVKEESKDTFEQKGHGFGKTFDLKFIPFRIDFVFVDESMQVSTHQNFEINLSDHYPLLTLIRF